MTALRRADSYPQRWAAHLGPELLEAAGLTLFGPAEGWRQAMRRVQRS